MRGVMMKKITVLMTSLLLVLSCVKTGGTIQVSNESGEVLSEIQITDAFKTPVVSFQNVESNKAVAQNELALQTYLIKISFQDKSFIQHQVFLQKKQREFNFIVNQDKNLVSTDKKDEVLQFHSSKQLGALEQQIDELMEASEAATVQGGKSYCSLLASYFDQGLVIELNGTPLTTEADLLAQFDQLASFELTYANSAQKDEIEDRFFDEVYNSFLEGRPKPPQNLLEGLDLPGVREDENFIYMDDFAIHKLNYGLVNEIKQICGIGVSIADTKGFKLPITPLWREGKYRYAFHKTKGGDSAFQSAVQSAMAKWIDCFVSPKKLEVIDVSGNDHLYRLWHLGLAYISVVQLSDKESGELGFRGQSSFPGQIPWQFIKIASDRSDDIKTMIHEIGHNLGLMHEHQRGDRDINVLGVWEKGPQWLKFSGYDNYYDINSIMHYDWLSDPWGNIACNSGYLSEQDKRFITRLYDEENPYLSPIPVVNRITFKSYSNMPVKVYDSFNADTLVFGNEVSITRGSEPYHNQNESIPEGVLDLPGFDNSNGSCNFFREKYNRLGFDTTLSYADKTYYIDYSRSENMGEVFIDVYSFPWQVLVSSQNLVNIYGKEILAGEKIKEGIDHHSFQLSNVLNPIDITSTAENGDEMTYHFVVVRNDNELNSIRAEVNGTEIFNEQTFNDSPEYNINYVYHSGGVRITVDLKEGQKLFVDNVAVTVTGLQYEQTFVLNEYDHRQVLLDVCSTSLSKKKRYILNLNSLTESVLPNSFSATNQQQLCSFPDADALLALANSRRVVEATKNDDPNMRINCNLKPGQKLFYREQLLYDWVEVATPQNALILSNFTERNIVEFKVVTPLGGDDVDFFFTLDFIKYVEYDCTLSCGEGGLIRVNGDVISPNESKSYRFKSYLDYLIEIRGNGGFIPNVPSELVPNPNKNEQYFLKTDSNCQFHITFKPKYSNEYYYEEGISPDSSSPEVVICRLKITGDISVGDNVVYLRNLRTPYTVTINKEEEATGWAHFTKLNKDGSLFFETKHNYFSNGKYPSKNSNGPATLEHWLKAQKAGVNMWQIGPSIRMFYQPAKF